MIQMKVESPVTVAVFGDVHLIDTPPSCRKDDYYEAMLSKLDTILSTNDAVVGLGDLFHRPAIPFAAFRKVVKLLLKHRKAGKTIWVIIGNHDVAHYNAGTLNHSALGLLDMLTLVRVVHDRATVGPVTFHVVPFARKAKFPQNVAGEHSVVLGHCFFEQSLDPGYSITREEVANSGARLVLLGHDHESYPDAVFGGTTLVRMGSLCRNTSHAYNLKRQVEYLRLHVDPVKGLTGWERQPVPALPAADVFNEAAFEKPDANPVTYVTNLTAVMERFQKLSARGSGQQYTMRQALQDVEAPAEVVGYLDEVYSRLGRVLR